MLDDLAQAAPTCMESALLLRDLWEVLQTTEYRIDQYNPDEDHRYSGLIRGLLKAPFAGEEVLF